MAASKLPEGIDPEMLSGIVPDADLLRLMDEAEKAPEPGTAQLGMNQDLKPEQVIHRGDDEVPAALIAKTLNSAGYVRLYNTKTGEPTLCNRNMLPAQLRKRHDDGTIAFTTRYPGFKPVRGSMKCLLHPDVRSPEHDAMGLPTCSKSDITSSFQVKLHMQHRHKSAWSALEEERLANERKEQMELQRQLLAVAVGQRSEPMPETGSGRVRSEEEIQAAKDRMAKARAARGHNN